MELIREFKDLKKNDVAIAGGKGASLGEMLQVGIPVPNGFVILSNAFERFIEETDLNVEIDSILHKVKHDDVNSVENASEQIKVLIMNAKTPKDIEKEIKRYYKKLNTKYVAVRSSATAEDSSAAAWAGQLESYLNTTKDNLLENVKKCWASLFTPRAIFYRFEKDLHKQKISVAVVIQKMIESEVSGIAFSVHPVTQDRNQLIIEAGFGLGEAIVSGQITPDSYVIEKSPRRIIDKNIVKQEKGLYKVDKGGNEWSDIKNWDNQKLSDKEILELSELILKIEKHYGFPCDIEWAKEKGKFYIVQSRPITTLTDQSQKSEEKIKLKQVVTRKYGLLTSELFIRGLSNPKNYKELLLVPNSYVSTGVIFDRWFFGPQIAQLGKKLLEKETKEEGFVEKSFGNVYKFGDKLLEESNKIKNTNFSKVNDFELVRILKDFAKLYETFSVSLTGWGLQIPVEAQLREILKDRPNMQEDLAVLTFPIKQNIVNIEQEELLKICIKIKKKNKKIEEYKDLSERDKQLIIKHVERFGWMTRGGLDNPWTIEEVFNRIKDSLRENCEEKLIEIKKWREEGKKKSDLLLKELHADKKLRRLVEIAKELVYYRTYRTDFLNLTMFNIRPLLNEIGRCISYNFIETSYLTFDEITKLKKIDDKELAKRMKNFLIFTIKPNEIIFTIEESKINDIENEYTLKEIIVSNEVKGNTAYPGKVKGKVVLIRGKKDLPKVAEGDIIVTTMTTPDYVIAMRKAAAFVTDEGGITCHAAIVAREMKKPCIIGTKYGTRLLKDGDLVEVDADNGVVKILKSSNEKENWLVVVSFKTELLTEAIIHRGYRESLPKLLPQIPKFNNRMIIDNDIYIDLTETGKIQEYFSTDTIDKATKVYEAIKKQSEKLIEVSKKVIKNGENIDNTELSKRLEEFFREYQNTIGAIGVPTIIDLTIESRLKEILRESSVKNIEEALSALAVSFKPVETSKEKEDLLKLAEKISKNRLSLNSKEVTSLINKHYDEYGWLHSTLFLGELYNESEIKQEIKEVLNNVKEEITKLKTNKKEHLSNAEEIIKKIKPKEGKKLAKFFQKAVYYRTARLEWMNKACFIVRPLLEDASRRLKIGFEDIIYLLPEEIISSLKEGKLTQDIKRAIEDRHKGYAYISDNKNEYLLAVNKELNEWKRKFSKEHNEDLVKGIVVFKGEAKGRAVVIKDRSELDKVEKGDILVTRLTTPDFVIAMKKSIGIVTDLGGVTSHAAVTSRELKIPCIVGTKNATKIIKGGDIIELDTTDGSVKILEKF